jgi:formylglycine-generating enzyme required for sulfatase activity
VPPGATNDCGGLGTLSGNPLGSACGACSDGVVACDGSDPLRRRTACTGASAQNACGGCGILDATVGSACGTCGTGDYACDGTSLVCSNDGGGAAANVCGGCSTLAANLGDPCGRCGSWACDTAVPGRLACNEPAGGCATVAVCGNGAVETGESCDDGNRVTEACAYAALSCTVCDASCQSVAGATAYCGDGVLDAAEVCDEGASNGAGSCSVACGCATGYHLEGGVCTSDTRACVVPNGTGSESWTGSGYGVCVATACASGYSDVGGVCLGILGAACTLNAECASGFCATGPDGTANDRCAPTGMNYIPAGTFTMGSPLSESGRDADEVEHSVTLSRSFFLDQTEVTQGQWKALSGGLNPSFFQTPAGTAQTTFNNNDSGPVEYLDWYAAVAFANARSAAEGLTSCYTLSGCDDAANGWKDGIHSGCTGATFAGLTCSGYRLPTESEWEYASRAGSTTATYLGNLSSGFSGDCTTSEANLNGIAWWCRNAGGRTQAVGGKSPNSFGLSDMLGNVREWTGDLYADYPGTVTDPTGPTTGSDRVSRGGAWINIARYARAAARANASALNRINIVGLRLARTVPPTAPCTEGTASYLGGCSPDADADGVADVADNCADFPNPDQLDFDRNGLGDLCDPDIDGDSDGNATDCADYDPEESSLAVELCDGQDNNCNGLRDDGATGCPCPTASYGGHNYLVCGSQSLSWNDAESFCLASGYHLVTVSDAGENSWLSGGAGLGAACSNTCRDADDGLCDDGGPGADYSICGLGTDCGDCGPRGVLGSNFWIGYNDIASEGSFVWSSGAPAAFVSWNSGVPDNSSNEDCTEFRLGRNNWNDLNCATGHPFICETDP